ncbi:hypothetical protein [Gilliamella sp. Nev3-1]|uniref:hypothetical protein n=1 Tax=Gilliamella sp. Nev3-1 TaxID=3120250 RepID=UPI00159EC1BB|nr:hypothetical protein [Gilliamella apicola]
MSLHQHRLSGSKWVCSKLYLANKLGNDLVTSTNDNDVVTALFNTKNALEGSS